MGFFFQIVLSGQSVHSLTKMNSDLAANNNENNVDGKTYVRFENVSSLILF